MIKRLDPTKWLKSYDNTRLINVGSGTSIKHVLYGNIEFFAFNKANEPEKKYLYIFKDIKTLNSYGLAEDIGCVNEEYFNYLKRIFIEGWDYSDIVTI